ncbi:type II toxin-antitoxin system VapC family toxin [Streptomyces sp. NBC_01267]|uniref:type II toxin-antitoxin system VapC family toxin n=1 Tax=unclassified Streptomyces TaxID=2593676 RepID=UPI002DDC4133|nr:MULTISPECIES: type II toxin-antitoxin system VapC family toxin [unclassified Streptomyces]WSC19840.1 type II toxin-antitoxin system VapC family toxin [Streptomyces sp. NBC_01766]
MRLLLDTRVVLWWLGDSPELSGGVKELLDYEPGVYVSAASLWEITVKQLLGSLVGPVDLVEQVCALAFGSLPLTAEHGVRAGRLPLVHTDPFDRILIAQAQAEEMVLVTRSRRIPQYDVQVMRV